MNDSDLFEREIRIKNMARCPNCEKGIVRPKYPDHKEIWDYICDKCDYWIHYDKNVIVE